MYNHNKAQQSKNRVHISWDILYGVSIWQALGKMDYIILSTHYIKVASVLYLQSSP